MRGTRVIAATAAVLLAAIVVCAIALVVSAPSASQVTATSLDVGPGAPSTATGVVEFSDTSGLTATADCTFDFAGGAADIAATATFSIATVSLEVRLIDTTLLADLSSLGSLTGAPWVSAPAPRAPAALQRLARELRRPDLAALHADTRTVTHGTSASAGATTTTTLTFRHVTLPSTAGLPITLPSGGRLVLRITVGSKGQLLGVSAHLVGLTDSVRASLQMTGYNQPVHVAAPRPSDVVPLTAARIGQIFGTNAPAVAQWLRRLEAPAT